MTGCPEAAACALACWDGEESQQPMCPHRAHLLKWNHQPPASRHSAQPVPLGRTAGSMSVSVAITYLPLWCHLDSHAGTGGGPRRGQLTSPDEVGIRQDRVNLPWSPRLR